MPKITYFLEQELVFKEKSKDWQFQDLEGQKFGRLMVLGYAGGRHWFCRCDCGNITNVYSGGLKNGTSKSCGCFHKEQLKERMTTHGHKKNGKASSTYNSWVQMLNRCHNTKSTRYHDYGGRGIKVCERWQSFENFLEDMGERPKGLTIDRINNNGNYEPGNCRWATRKEQNNNQRSNIPITFNGKTQNLTQWSCEIGIKKITLWARINTYGWSIERALTTH